MPLTVSPRALLAIIASAVLALGLALLAAPPASAASNTVFYQAQLAEPASAATIVAGGTAWRCEGSACSAGKSSSRDAIVCAKLVKEVGQLTSFTSPKGALEADDLARCNQG
jgi:hypothetical protein